MIIYNLKLLLVYLEEILKKNNKWIILNHANIKPTIKSFYLKKYYYIQPVIQEIPILYPITTSNISNQPIGQYNNQPMVQYNNQPIEQYNNQQLGQYNQLNEQYNNHSNTQYNNQPITLSKSLNNTIENIVNKITNLSSNQEKKCDTKLNEMKAQYELKIINIKINYYKNIIENIQEKIKTTTNPTEINNYKELINNLILLINKYENSIVKYKKSLTINYLDEFEIPYNDVSELLKLVNEIKDKLKGI